MIKKLVLLMGMVAAFNAVDASAQVKAGQANIMPFIGGYLFDGDQHLKHNLVYGLRAGYSLTRNVGVEGVFDYVGTEATRGVMAGASDDVNAFSYGLDVLYHFMPDNALVPFVAAGVRGTFIDTPPGSKNTKTALLNYGAGVQYFFTDRFALRGDVRHLIPVDFFRSNLEYTVGLNYLFGRKATPVPVAAKPAPEPPPAPAAPVVKQALPPAAPAAAPVPEPVKVVEAPPMAPVAKPVVAEKPAPTPEQLCMRLDINFDSDKSAIKPKYHAEIARVAHFMKEYPETKAVIEGHTDNRAGKAYNQKLSEQRAQSVKSYLVSKFGIDSARLSTAGYGFSRPLSDNETAEGRQKNRRIIANFGCVDKK